MSVTNNTNKFTVGLVQMTSSDVISENIVEAEHLIRKAAEKGADFILTPEMTTLLNFDSKKLMGKLSTEEQDTSWRHFASLAKELNIWLLIGSMPVKNGEKAANRSFLFSPKGKKVVSYDKIHMFNVDLPNGEKYRESNLYEAGNNAVMAELPWGKIGLSICYDLRFPYLYRTLAKAGATMLAVPAAFTKVTGEAHWHTLLRARAIENGAFIFAPAQVGEHAGGRKTYGHSLIIDPWGNILEDGGTDTGVILAEIDMEKASQARNLIGSLTHDKNIAISPMNS